MKGQLFQWVALCELGRMEFMSSNESLSTMHVSVSLFEINVIVRL